MQFTIRPQRAVCLTTLALVLLVATGTPGAGAQTLSHNINDYVASKLDDFSATMRVMQHDDRAGQKINKDFGLIYMLKGDVALKYKEENKLRMDGRLGTATVSFVVNGTKQYVRTSLGLKDDRDLGASPGKRKTLLDVGLLSSGYLAYTEGQYLYNRPVEGVMCAVFRISYRDKTLDTSHRLVWLDPKTKITLKREEYSQIGKLNATFYYRDPQEIAPGVWFPSRIEVLNNEGQKAGVTAYSKVKINLGLEDSLFKL